MQDRVILGVDNVFYSRIELVERANSFESGDMPLYQIHFWHFIQRWFDESDTIDLKTSGSTGVPKVITVPKDRMRKSAQRTVKFFQLAPSSKALLALSAEYIAGQMMIVRAIEGHLNLILVEPSSTPFDTLTEPVDFATLVPMQLSKYSNHHEKLQLIGKLIVGGAAVSKSIENILADCTVEAYESYGMTETLSHIALRRINGVEKEFTFRPLDGVKIGVDDRGALMIFDPLTLDEPIQTNDIACIENDGTFRIVGRVDNVINSGGVKVSPEELEQIISPLISSPFAISWVNDERLGQRVVIVSTKNIEPEELYKLNEKLPKYKRITKSFCVDEIPLLISGKLDRLKLQTLVEKLT